MPRIINVISARYRNLTRYRQNISLIGETVVAIAVINISIILTRYFTGTDFVLSTRTGFFAILLYLTWMVLFEASSLSIIPRTQRYRTLVIRSFQNTFIALLICLFFWAIVGYNSIPILIIPMFIGLRFFYTVAERLAHYKLFRLYRSRGYNTLQIIVIADDSSEIFIERLLNRKEWGFDIKYVLSDSELIHSKFSERLNILGEDADLKYLLDYDVVDEVIYCKNRIDTNYLKKVIRISEEVGVLFRIQSNLSPLEPARLQLQTVHMRPDMQILDSRRRQIETIVKNISDIFFSFTALVFLSPVFILFALIIKLDSPGPVFFIQERIGLRGRKFNLIKFRTMVQDAESVLNSLEKQNEADGPTFKIKNDPRITKIGRILRKTGLDELPQLINVVVGEMSLIGPRPPLEKEVIQYERWQLRRLSVKPGITCTWQVLENRNEVSFDLWMKLDLQYIDNWSITNDIKLFFLTLNSIIKATGS